MADLPGLIEGAHQNFGMGHRFLKHVERTKLLLFVIDINGFQLSSEYPQRNSFENLVLLNRELELYNSDLLKKPAILAINKMDTENSDQNLEDFQYFLTQNYEEGVKNLPEEMVPETKMQFKEILTMSAENDEKSVQNLKDKIRSCLDELDQSQNPIQELEAEIDKLLDTKNNDKLLL